MNYWWVSQKKTYRQEINGGYMWSPKANKNGQEIQPYKNMTLVEPGDIVFSFYNKEIRSVGIATEAAVTAKKPSEFGQAGKDWSEAGWLVRVTWQAVPTPFSPKNHLNEFLPVLPDKHSPIRQNGEGNQAYLFALEPEFALLIAVLANIESEPDHSNSWDDTSSSDYRQRVQSEVKQSGAIGAELKLTEKIANVKVRLGQGAFRSNLSRVESKCRLTGLNNSNFLIASHIKPWAKCDTNAEKLDGNNGLWLTPNADKLFDKGFISFKDNGEMLVSNQVEPTVLKALHIPTSLNVGSFKSAQQNYLAFHREHVFKG